MLTNFDCLSDFLTINVNSKRCFMFYSLSANKNFNSDILIFLYTVLHALSMGALPWIPSIYGMAAARGVTGYCCGGQDIGTC